MEKQKESSLRRFMVSEDTVPLKSPVNPIEETVQQQSFFPWKDPISTEHPYFTEKSVKTFLDEDAAVNVNNSEDPAPEE